MLNKIKLYNYKQFEGEQMFSFEKINFVKGRNGVGKSNLSLWSLLFARYGYTGKDKLQELPTEGKAKSCWVEIQENIKGKTYTIRRHIPSKVSIKKDGEEIKFKEQSSRDKNNFLKKIFDTVINFKTFHIVDAYDKEVNFLDKGDTVVKKLLFSIYEGKINSIRQRLLALKYEREKYNKDEAVVHKVFPSKKRLRVLKEGIDSLEDELNTYERKIAKYTDKKIGLIEDKSKIVGTGKYIVSQINKLKKYNSCPFCGTCLEDKDKVLSKKRKYVKKLKADILALKPEIEKYRKWVNKYEHKKEKVYERIEELNELVFKLESRFKQKDYKYTNRDVLTMKEAINKLDTFSALYLNKSIQTLVPLMNSVLKKINHKVRFSSDGKKFTMELIDNKNRIWKYHRLSTGQKLVVQIALKLALLLERGETGLIIADEGLGSLDRENLSHIISLFQNYPFQLIFILHNFEDIPEGVNVIDLDRRKS